MSIGSVSGRTVFTLLALGAVATMLGLDKLDESKNLGFVRGAVSDLKAKLHQLDEELSTIKGLHSFIPGSCDELERQIQQLETQREILVEEIADRQIEVDRDTFFLFQKSSRFRGWQGCIDAAPEERVDSCKAFISEWSKNEAELNKKKIYLQLLNDRRASVIHDQFIANRMSSLKRCNQTESRGRGSLAGHAKGSR